MLRRVEIPLERQRGVDQHDPVDLVRIGAGVEEGQQASERVPGQHVRRLLAGRPQQPVQILDRILGGAHAGNLLALPDVAAVVGAGAGVPKLVPGRRPSPTNPISDVDGLKDDAVQHDDGRRARSPRSPGTARVRRRRRCPRSRRRPAPRPTTMQEGSRTTRWAPWSRDRRSAHTPRARPGSLRGREVERTECMRYRSSRACLLPNFGVGVAITVEDAHPWIHPSTTTSSTCSGEPLPSAFTDELLPNGTIGVDRRTRCDCRRETRWGPTVARCSTRRGRVGSHPEPSAPITQTSNEERRPEPGVSKVGDPRAVRRPRRRTVLRCAVVDEDAAVRSIRADDDDAAVGCQYEPRPIGRP